MMNTGKAAIVFAFCFIFWIAAFAAYLAQGRP